MSADGAPGTTSGAGAPGTTSGAGVPGTTSGAGVPGTTKGAAQDSTRPIFVIGSPRSGTTLVRMILDSHPAISCGPETHFLTDLERVAERHRHRIERYGFDRSSWDRRIRDFFAGFQVDYMERRGKRRWAEKTPGYTLRLPFVDRLFPDAQYLHVIRDGRDVVASYRERWGYRAAAGAAARQWVRHVTAARTFGAEVGPERYLEVRYEALVRDPEPVLRRLFEFLGEAWDPAVLRFDEQEHDAARYREFTAGRREQAGDSGPIYASRIGAGARELDPILRALLSLRARQLLRELGYTD